MAARAEKRLGWAYVEIGVKAIMYSKIKACMRYILDRCFQ
jgi:hypothetical protein